MLVCFLKSSANKDDHSSQGEQAQTGGRILRALCRFPSSSLLLPPSSALVFHVSVSVWRLFCLFGPPVFVSSPPYLLCCG